MIIDKDTVVSIRYELSGADGEPIERSDDPIDYLHGGYHGIFERVEQALDGKIAGATVELRLEPGDAFGDYDDSLLRAEPRGVFPENVAVGMRFEGRAEGSDEMRVYTVTNVADDKVVVDGNHPLAGRSLQFSCTVTAVRAATAEEISHGHVHGPHGHHH